MDFSTEQTPLISSNRESIFDNRLGPGKRGFYTAEPRVAAVSRPQNDSLPRPQRQPPLLHQSLERASWHEQAHTITPQHWLVLTLACLLLLGNYYCYDIPGALNVQLREWLGTDYTAHQYYLNLLYSVYSLPNIVLPLMGGILIDHLSASRMLLIFSLLVCAGQGIFAIGVSTKSIWTMVLGRLVFGIGGECLEVAQAKITTDWFKARWLGFALGLNLSFARIGTALNDNISPVIATGGGGVVAASWTGFAVCGLSLAAGIWLSHLDRADSRKSAGVRPDVSYKRSDRTQSRTDNIIGRHALNASSDSTMSMSSVALEEEDEIEKDDEMAQDDRMLLSEVFTLQPNFWVLSLCCIALYGAVVPFIHVSSDFLQKKWYANNPTKAGTVMSIPDIVSAIGSPLCGYLVDQFGYRARYIPVSALLLIWAHVQLGFTLFTPIMAMFILGLAYSLFASVLWPCIPFLVKDHQLGTAYGLVTIALNISLTIFPLVVASILETTQGSYSHVEGLFITLAFIGLLLSILFNILDYRQGGYLQLTENFLDLYSDDDDEGRTRRDQRAQRVRQDPNDPREPGFEYRRSRRYSRALLAEEDPDIEDVQVMVTTKPVGDGIIAVIPHRRRHSMTGFSGHLERARLSQLISPLDTVPESMPNPSPYYSTRRPRPSPR